MSHCPASAATSRRRLTVLLVLCGLVASAFGSSAATAATTDPIAHDPTIAKEGDWYYAVITGDIGRPRTYLPMKRSRDLVHWQELGPVFQQLPAHVIQSLGTTPGDAWAPDLSRGPDGRWRLYYAASQFGTTNSVISLATTPTLDPDAPGFGWRDGGQVVRSEPGADVNAIDPDVVRDEQGRSWLAYGSFFGGLVLRRLDPATGKLSATDTAVRRLASRAGNNAMENPSIVARGGWFYLLASYDYCCHSTNSDYRTVVGRSGSVEGPYVDRAGVPMLQGGGTELIRGFDEFNGAGGGDVLLGDGRKQPDLFVHHYYDGRDDGVPKLQVNPISWSADGWPLLGPPVSGESRPGRGPATLSINERTGGRAVAVRGCGLEGTPLELRSGTSDPCAQWRLDPRAASDTVSLNNIGTNKVAEIAACRNADGTPLSTWGWLANDCQRFRLKDGPDGYLTIANAVSGRLVGLAGGSADGAGLTLGGVASSSTRQFLVRPVGDVLLVQPGSSEPIATGKPCKAKTTGRDRTCAWTFTPADGVWSTVTRSDTGEVLRVGRGSPKDARGPEAQWRLSPVDGGVSWALVNRATNTRLATDLRRPAAVEADSLR